MLRFKISLIGLILTGQSATANAAQPSAQAATTSNSCLQAMGALGSAPNAAIRIVDGSTFNSPSDVRSLRKKAKDGLPIIVKGGNFSGKKFGSDDFSNICFEDSDLTNTRWSKTRADGVAFINANLTGATFDRVTLRGGLFRNSILTRMDASGANFSNGQLDGGWDPSMAGLRLENAQMTGFRFLCGTNSNDGCSFDRKQISLRGANLTNAKLGSFALWDANLVDVVLNNTEIALDQIPQYANANVKGPLIIQSAGKQSTLSPAAFQQAVAAFGAPAKPDTECNSPATPLSQIFCQTGQSGLRAHRDDIDRLYQSISRQQRPDGTTIIVTAPTKDQERYLSKLSKCALKAEDKAITCISTAMAKRRAALVVTLTKNSPLEPDARALFVNAESPLLQSLSRDERLSSLTPLMIGSSPTFLLVYQDDDNLLNARGVSQSPDGARCVYGFASVSLVKSRKANAKSSAFLAWSSGAEFAVKPQGKIKRKKIKKKRGNKQTATASPTQPETVSAAQGCATSLQSGPLVRVPLPDDIFDLLWTDYRTASL
jgi:Pentapeptide repeats (8 copies)